MDNAGTTVYSGQAPSAPSFEGGVVAQETATPSAAAATPPGVTEMTGREPAGRILAVVKQEGITAGLQRLARGDIGSSDAKVEKGEVVEVATTTESPKILPKEITSDPLYMQKLGELAIKAQEEGKPIDMKALSQEALIAYEKAKATQTEEKITRSEVSPENTREEYLAMALERAMNTNEVLYREMFGSAKELTEIQMQLAAVSEQVKQLTKLTALLIQYIHEKDEKKKESTWVLILRMFTLLGISLTQTFVEEVEEDTIPKKKK